MEMSPLEALAEQVTWAGRNLAFNLQFVPADRLDWKPAPGTKSALEIVNHSLDCLRNMTPVLRGSSFQELTLPRAVDRDSAQTLIVQAAEAYAAALRAMTPLDLERPVELPHGRGPLKQFCAYEVIDLIHHHGQIVYLQTLLGDLESHFVAEGAG
jgi:uncharacterized damage-inducible protein DinB